MVSRGAGCPEGVIKWVPFRAIDEQINTELIHGNL